MGHGGPWPLRRWPLDQLSQLPAPRLQVLSCSHGSRDLVISDSESDSHATPRTAHCSGLEHCTVTRCGLAAGRPLASPLGPVASTAERGPVEARGGRRRRLCVCASGPSPLWTFPYALLVCLRSECTDALIQGHDTCMRHMLARTRWRPPAARGGRAGSPKPVGASLASAYLYPPPPSVGLSASQAGLATHRILLHATCNLQRGRVQ